MKFIQTIETSHRAETFYARRLSSMPWCVILMCFFLSICATHSLHPSIFNSRTSVHDSVGVDQMRAPSVIIDKPGLSTVTKPKRKTSPDTKKKSAEPEKDGGFVIKESRSLADEMEAYFASDDYLVILYNDPFNKRQYVSGVLQEIFSWDDMQADAVMLQAHQNGYAVAVETSKEKAETYVRKLLEKGLIAEARKAGDAEPESGSS